MASYIHKRREYRGKVARAFGADVASWGPWVSLDTYPTLEAAKYGIGIASKHGLYQHAIFHKGKRLP